MVIRKLVVSTKYPVMNAKSTPQIIQQQGVAEGYNIGRVEIRCLLINSHHIVKSRAALQSSRGEGKGRSVTSSTFINTVPCREISLSHNIQKWRDRV